MLTTNRREFLGNLGVLFAGAGAWRVGAVGGLWSDEIAELRFGELEPLVARMQEVEANELQRFLIDELQRGVPQERLVAAAALANARTFGGEDYDGYHVLMALIPALEMSRWVEPNLRALPVLKVLHRNTRRILAVGGRSKERMHAVDRSSLGAPNRDLLAATRGGSLPNAIDVFASQIEKDPLAAFSALQPVVRDNIDVHQVVLAWRSWDLRRIVGNEHTETLLLQAMRQCVQRENHRVERNRAPQSLRKTLPRAMAKHGLVQGTSGATGKLSDQRLDELANTFMTEDRDVALETAARTLATGTSPAALGEAISLASVRLLLHDPGRANAHGEGKPAGTIHGASVGIHAADSANAWRHIADVVEEPNAVATLLAAAWHTAGQTHHIDPSRVFHDRARNAAKRVPEAKLLDATFAAIDDGDQALATALTERYGATGGDPGPLVRGLTNPLLDQDGALHHEKFFHTAVEEYHRTRSCFRWEWLTALSRVAASGRGFPAPGVADARERLSS